MIAGSKEVKEWNLEINLEPDYIEAKILKKPGILVDVKAGNSVLSKPRTLDDNRILTQIVQ